MLFVKVFRFRSGNYLPGSGFIVLLLHLDGENVEWFKLCFHSVGQSHIVLSFFSYEKNLSVNCTFKERSLGYSGMGGYF